MLSLANELLLTSPSSFEEVEELKKLYLNRKKNERC